MTLIKRPSLRGYAKFLCDRQPTKPKNNFSFEKTHQVSNLTDTLTEEPTDDIDVSSVFRLLVFGILADFFYFLKLLRKAKQGF